MTKQELIEMMGSEDKADWAMNRLLESVKPDFVVMVLKAYAEQKEKELKEKEASGYYEEYSEFPEGFNVWNATPEQEQQWDENERREVEHSGDKMTATFAKNMYIHAHGHKPQE